MSARGFAGGSGKMKDWAVAVALVCLCQLVGRAEVSPPYPPPGGPLGTGSGTDLERTFEADAVGSMPATWAGGATCL